jgi:hypothetical protein
MDESRFKSRRLTRDYRQTISATPEKVFPLLCPVREADWLEGWNYNMIYSMSGLVEDGAVFSTPLKGEEDTVWVVTHHDPVIHAVDFVRFTPGSRTCVLKIIVTSKDDSTSYVDIRYTYTGITPEGNDFIDGFSEEAFIEAMIFWEKSMNYYLKTGQRFKKY